jgi:hypothetical protein
MSKPRYELEFEQVEAIRKAQRRGEWPSRQDQRYALGFAYLDKMDSAVMAAERKSIEARRKREEIKTALRGQWWNRGK